MSYPSYSPLDHSAYHAHARVNVRPFRPLQPPPVRYPLPPLPSSHRNPVFSSLYTLTTHLYPSAYPHSHSVVLPRSAYADQPNETKEERKERQGCLLSELYSEAKAHQQGIKAYKPSHDVFWNVINRIVRKDAGKQGGGLTLFLAHANGFPKETWEPALLEIFSRVENTGVIVDEAWVFEAVQHGDSALVNESILGRVFDWTDNARDVLNFLLYHLPSEVSPASLPTHLSRLSDEVVDSRKTAGYSNRTLVAIGHSLGGCTVSRATIEFPALVSSLILVDPIIIPVWADINKDAQVRKPKLANLASQRRSNWGSREEALSGFQKSSFFTSWNPAVLDKYITYGLAPDPAGGEGAVKLKMPGFQEAVVFLHRQTSYETWELLLHIPSHIEILFIMNGKDKPVVGGEEASRETVWRRKGNVSNVILPEVGHLIPQEAPEVFGQLVADFLVKKYRIIRKAAL